MIAWWWLIVAVLVGFTAALFVMAVLIAAGKDEEIKQAWIRGFHEGRRRKAEELYRAMARTRQTEKKNREN